MPQYPIKTIAFDADDTLWVNEPNYQAVEHRFFELLHPFKPQEAVMKALLETENRNIPLYGYGVKGFMLSMIETALQLTNHKISIEVLETIIAMGKELIEKPIELLDDIVEVLEVLKDTHQLIIATKGDLLDQQRKLAKSGLIPYFDHIEIMSDKKEGDYAQLLKKLNVRPQEFVMIGNSLKSDILPVINIGGFGVYIPYHVTWQHEKVEEAPTKGFHKIERMAELLEWLK